MEHLPMPIVLSIVAFAVRDYSKETHKYALSSLKPLALVCRSWHILVREIVARYQCSTLTLKFYSGSFSEYMTQRRRVTERGPQIKELNIRMGEAPARGLGMTFLSTWKQKDIRIDWDVIFFRLPALRRLDLSGVQLFSGQVEQILTSAAKYCKNVVTLVLATVDETLQDRVNFESIFSALYKALQIWYFEGTCRGLKRLTVPILDENNRLEAYRRHFDNIIKFCPELKYLDGYKKTLCEIYQLTCRDNWSISVDQWEEFNATCSQLREFHWIVVPFADQFFKVFGEHIKPHLKKLTFAVNMTCNWEEYSNSLEIAGETEAFLALQSFSQPPGYGRKAIAVSSALKGCPSLNDLSVELYHPVNEGAVSDDNPLELLDYEGCNIDIYDDNFCETLAKHCPWVTKFVIREVLENPDTQFTPIRTFTDKGLVALAKLKYLTSLELRTINCTGKGLFDFLDRLSDEFLGQRTLQICLGGHHSEYQLAFYHAMIEVLTQLERRSPTELEWRRHKFVLRLINSNFDSIRPDWSEQFFVKLTCVVERVQKIHPTLRLRIAIIGRQGSTFKKISEFGLYTSDAKPSLWFDWHEDEADDSPFFNRRKLLDESIPFDYPEDYYHDPYSGYEDFQDYYVSDGSSDGFDDSDDDAYDDENMDDF
ncbi:putative leucine-rich repeat domain superfamily [Plasmopara halstedii]